MLVLTRKSQESVVVGGCKGFERVLKVTVLQVEGARVRLGFEISKEVPILRWEVWEKAGIDNPPSRHTGGLAAYEG